MVASNRPSPLSATVLRNLSDRAYDKRKSAALEIEAQVKVGSATSVHFAVYQTEMCEFSGLLKLRIPSGQTETLLWWQLPCPSKDLC